MSDYAQDNAAARFLARIMTYAPRGLAHGGQRHSWLVEIPVLIGVIVALSLVLKPRIDLLHAAPHPFWIPVVAAALVHGIVPGVFASLLAGLCNWFFAGALITTEDDYYDVMFKTFKEPVLWLFAVLVLGTFRERVEDERRRLAQERDEAKDDLSRVVDHASELRDRIDELERAIALSEIEAERPVQGCDRTEMIDRSLATTCLEHEGDGGAPTGAGRMSETDRVSWSRLPRSAALDQADTLRALTAPDDTHDGDGLEAGPVVECQASARLDAAPRAVSPGSTKAVTHGPTAEGLWRSLLPAIAANDQRDGEARMSLASGAPTLASIPTSDRAERQRAVPLDRAPPPWRPLLSRRCGLFIRKAPRRSPGGRCHGQVSGKGLGEAVALHPDTSYTWRWVSLWKLQVHGWVQTAGEGSLHYPDAGRLLRRMEQVPRIYDSRNAGDRSALPEDALLACPVRIGLGPATEVILIGGGHIGETASLHDIVTRLFEIAVELDRRGEDEAAP